MSREKQIELQKKINDLPQDEYHQLFFDYSLKKNWLKKPFLLIFKLFCKIENKPVIYHVCHISRFVPDGKNWIAKVFEATVHGGMEENDLFEKLKHFKGKIYIRTLGKVDKEKAREFEKKYTGQPYDALRAGLAGLDIDLIDKCLNLKKKQSGFCSWLEALFMENQGYNIKNIEKGVALEITPMDLFQAQFSSYPIKLFYNSK